MRKRLSHYLERGTADEVQILLLCGSYVPEFHFPETGPANVIAGASVKTPPANNPKAVVASPRRVSPWR